MVGCNAGINLWRVATQRYDKPAWRCVCRMAVPQYTCMAPGDVLHQQYTHTHTAHGLVLSNEWVCVELGLMWLDCDQWLTLCTSTLNVNVLLLLEWFDPHSESISCFCL